MRFRAPLHNTDTNTDQLLLLRADVGSSTPCWGVFLSRTRFVCVQWLEPHPATGRVARTVGCVLGVHGAVIMEYLREVEVEALWSVRWLSQALAANDPEPTNSSRMTTVRFVNWSPCP